MTGNSTSPVHGVRVRVWDIPVRIVHWLIVFAFAVAWLTRGDRWLHVHVFAGYSVGALLLFRLVWGFVGSAPARFRNFTYRWRDVRDYLVQLRAGTAPHFIGHNPAGSWAVYLLLTSIALVVISGLLALGAEERQGPFAGLLGFAAGEIVHTVHELIAWLLLGLVAVHLLGVGMESRCQRQNLARAMITGRKQVPGDVRAVPAHAPLGLLMIGVLAGAALIYFWDALRADRPYLPFAGPALAQSALYEQECGDCHLAYHPTLLPARSWHALLAGQHDHFGEDLDLAADTLAALAVFTDANAAENGITQAGWKIDRYTRAQDTPLRITDTPYWQQKHDFDQRTWATPKIAGKFDCGACHLDAKRGTFRAGAMRLPN